MSARPTRSTSSTARKTKELFRNVFALGKGKKWSFMHSGLFLDFLAGNQNYECTPWGMPARNIFGWQKPCYLLGEGYAKTFKELMETTDWDTYGTGKYEKCADCMAHCGYEPTAANAAIGNPLEGAVGRAARHPDQARWRRRSRSISSVRRSTSSRRRSRRSCQRSAPREAEDARPRRPRQRRNAAKRARRNLRRRAISAGNLHRAARSQPSRSPFAKRRRRRPA